jgi:hypothetical protein
MAPTKELELRVALGFALFYATNGKLKVTMAQFKADYNEATIAINPVKPGSNFNEALLFFNQSATLHEQMELYFTVSYMIKALPELLMKFANDVIIPKVMFALGYDMIEIPAQDTGKDN